ncbi:hypothetical protein [Paenibacillus methanolicus]|uniref:Spore coat protein D n=1 Tax=Paenibacillus methanolicus TaxID=582686 RepID=A0A5S5BXU8_9BACL|nr:hypothetical protein [Paenibacillus methanolicus]TYP71867.1 hypothetical protein BCM02_109145 [Paenibacillus methanolicus]
MCDHRHCDPLCPTETIYDPPIRVVRDFFHPQRVQVVQIVEVVNRHHCVPVYEKVVQVVEREEDCTHHHHGGHATVAGEKAKTKSKSKGRRAVRRK